MRIYQTKGERGWQHLDSGRRVENKDGTVLLRLKAMKKDLPFPDYNFVTPGPKGMQFVDYYSTAEGEFHPMKMQNNEEILEKRPVDKDVLLWNLNQRDRMRKKYEKDKSRWEQLLPVILLGIVVAFSVFNTILTNQTGVQVAGISASVLDKTNTVWDHVNTVVDKLNAVQSDTKIISATGGNVPATPAFGAGK